METKSHSFAIEDAQKYGIEKAILLQNLRFWLDKELANTQRDEEDSGPKIREHEGTKYVWTYNSAKAFSELFPYMSEKSISRWLRELEDDGIIISGVFNKLKYDKTKWYTMPEYSIGQNVLSIAQKRESVAHFGQSEGQNGQSEGQNGQPIPDINTNINTNNFGDSQESPVDNSKNLRKELWETLVKVLGYSVDDITKNVRGQLANAVKQLMEVGATPEEIMKRAKTYGVLYPAASLTPMALVNRWADCIPKASTRPTEAFVGVLYDKPAVEYRFDDNGNVIL